MVTFWNVTIWLFTLLSWKNEWKEGKWIHEVFLSYLETDKIVFIHRVSLEGMCKVHHANIGLCVEVIISIRGLEESINCMNEWEEMLLCIEIRARRKIWRTYLVHQWKIGHRRWVKWTRNRNGTSSVAQTISVSSWARRATCPLLQSESPLHHLEMKPGPTHHSTRANPTPMHTIK